MRFAELVTVVLLVAVPISVLAQPPDIPPDLPDTDEGTVEDDATIPQPDDVIVGESLEEEVPPIPEDPAGILQVFYESLKAGDGATVVQLISTEALDNVEMMLVSLQDELDRDSDAAMSRLNSAGYTASLDEIEDWEPEDYLSAAVAVPRMKSRYAIYEMEVGEFTIDGDELEVPLTFATATGTEIPFMSRLVFEDDSWKVSTFMGLNSLP